MSYHSFEKWFEEQENFSTREERFVEEFGVDAVAWLKVAWGLGEMYGNRGMSGAVAEAQKDLRSNACHGGADILERVTMPETLAIEKSERERICAWANITPTKP